MNQTASHLAIRRLLPEFNTKWKVFMGRRWNKGALTKEKKELFLEPDIFGGRA